MDEVKKRGIKDVMQEAIQHVTKNTIGYGITIDIDSIDPNDAPGTGVAEPDGIRGNELCESLTLLANDQRLIGAEIAEFDPTRDKDDMTIKLIINLLSSLLLGKKV
jgi:arginase family enzyme